MKRPVLYLLVGYPGAGKTTVSKAISSLTGAEHIWADHERRHRFGTPSYSSDENSRLYDALNTTAIRVLSEGTDVVYDTNFNFYKDRQRLRDAAIAAGADCKLIWVTTPKEVARARAVRDAHIQETRVLGDMQEDDFERITQKLEPPTENEKPIIIDGQHIDEAKIKAALDL